MKNWVVKLLLLLFIPSLWEFCLPLSWVLIRVVGYKLRRMLSSVTHSRRRGFYRCFKMESPFPYINGGCKYGL